ncbi:hypothetical protein [Candidatus Soleaferrea massiliensis]|uniref:hypothetical protein n=1 Tax=Candidatus Soleaferrea massiliensis TaxID=1470354 RepID=UPI00069478BB|nr:hypothetical protein [Candidatus Soleaferrea massiliensis]
MKQQKTRTRMYLGTGASSILMIFIVLCLTTFGVLSYTSARADLKLTEKNEDAVYASYQAETQAQAILQQIDTVLGQARKNSAETGTNDKMLNLSRLSEIEGLTISEDTVSFSVACGDRKALQVLLKLTSPEEEKRYELISYRYVDTGEWQAEESGELWQGENREGS